MDSFDVTSTGPEETGRIASILAESLRAGDVILLRGALAAGKTTFVKGVAAALGSVDTVTSPTYMLAQFYRSESAPILHMDAYRLTGVAEYRDLGLEDYLADSITLIEWGEKLADDFPCHLTIDFRAGAADPDHRTLSFASSCDRWISILPLLRAGVTLEVA
ncbi:tRNA (adenosine(37)-N6)-threonylcarbamoyltransferase complex ATPase subunit type 1 TsaE [Phytohabitans flavus]|uniref:tRNA threonylcarbamoyladenosine biosynthesis protein TsaE n=1 Tax=Phytohabitans flavus TaxID=1076124 RepID=A0A6F8Y0A7_9ACTN|nr:tRNA (adenosine(37)-N6)-threonylcarbamoyltransferase complex ATPase subunit type 1 TsaE [Phytohabitans flavus]BCB79493.1 tRNA (adenosine(37)-N6)-threonylcarbamoyltransferase complex ATPase subunit type 1 TsaE [Phytohabitans flavus]